MATVSAKAIAAGDPLMEHRRGNWLLAEILTAAWGVSALIALGWVAWMY
jgi:hypothetical protein